MDGRSIPLDYIMNLPKEIRNLKLSKDKQVQTWKLANINKNIVMRRIIEIKREKAKPGLKEAIQLTIRRKQEQDEKLRRRLKKKVMAMYEKEISQNLNVEDQQFTKIILQIDRLHKILAAQSSQIVQLEKKILGKPSRTSTLAIGGAGTKLSSINNSVMDH